MYEQREWQTPCRGQILKKFSNRTDFRGKGALIRGYDIFLNHMIVNSFKSSIKKRIAALILIGSS